MEPTILDILQDQMICKHLHAEAHLRAEAFNCKSAYIFAHDTSAEGPTTSWNSAERRLRIRQRDHIILPKDIHSLAGVSYISA